MADRLTKRAKVQRQDEAKLILYLLILIPTVYLPRWQGMSFSAPFSLLLNLLLNINNTTIPFCHITARNEVSEKHSQWTSLENALRISPQHFMILKNSFLTNHDSLVHFLLHVAFATGEASHKLKQTEPLTEHDTWATCIFFLQHNESSFTRWWCAKNIKSILFTVFF